MKGAVTRHLALVVCAILITACGGTASTTVVATTDMPLEVDQELEALVGDAAGWFTVHVPSSAAGEIGVAVRVYYPARDKARFPQGAPVMVELPGGTGTGDLGPMQVDREVSVRGFVRVTLLLPGGQAAEGLRSGGSADARGAGSIQATRDVIRYAAGLQADTEGLLITDRIDYALVENLGVVGYSNGGNLALISLAEGGSALPVDWFVAWESPIGDQTITGELLGNPFFVPGTCAVTNCPWPGLGDALRFDPQGQTTALFGSAASWPGVFYADVDEDGAVTPGDDWVFDIAEGPPGPSQMLFPSQELLAEIWGRQEALFDVAPPAWLPSASEGAEFWALRDGSLRLAEVAAAFPELLVSVLQSERDHVQTSPDYPHTWSHLRGWSEAGHGFARLNPDAAYLAHVTGSDASLFPDNPAGALVPWPEASVAMVPTNVGGWVVGWRPLVEAAVLEMMDRVWSGDLSPNLDAVISIPASP